MIESYTAENNVSQTNKVYVSAIIPVYNEEENVEILCNTLINTFSELNKPFEIIFVDDGSTDNTVNKLKELTDKHCCIKIVRFRRNYGQTAAMAAGFDYAKGDVIVSLDGDLQNDPTDIPKLLAKLEEGYDVVSGWRKNRKDAFINRKLPSMVANKIIGKMTGVRLHDYGCSLKAYRAQIAKELNLYGEMHRFIPALASIEGASIVEMPVHHHARQFGKSKYNILRTFKVILDLLTVVFQRKFMTRPLHVFGRAGLFSFFIGSLICLYLVIDKLFFFNDIGNRPLLLLGVLMILTGFQLLSTGIIAEILIRTYYESQDKPIYRVKEVYSRSN